MPQHRFCPALPGLLILLPLCAATLGAQTTFGTITGTVTDSSGSPVPGAAVTARNEGTNIQTASTTNARGDYLVTHLNPGVYTVSCSLAGFKKFTRTGVELGTAATVRVDAQLEIGELAIEITVTGGVPPVETESPNVADARPNEVLLDTPINERGSWDGPFYQLLQLTPGAQSGSGAAGFSIGGARHTQQEYTIDGTVTASGPAQPSIETLREFKVDLANSKAEYSRPGMVTGASKSGTNQPHGSLFYYHKNSAFDARNAFSGISRPPFLIGHNAGGSFGGPVYLPKLYDGRDRTFFFLTVERFPTRSERVQAPSVPTLKMRQGDFTGRGTIRDPFTSMPFPGNVIPASMLNPVALRVQEKFYPLPNVADPNAVVRNWLGVSPQSQFKRQQDLRLDHRFSHANSIFGRITWGNMGQEFADSDLPTTGKRFQDRRVAAMTVADTYILSPSAINEFRYGMHWQHNPFWVRFWGPDLVKEFGIEGLSADLPQIHGMPVFRIGGVTAVNVANVYGNSSALLHQFMDSITWTRGSHSIKAGVEVRLNANTQDAANPVLAFGDYNFTTVFTGQAYADFLLGLPQTSSRLVPGPQTRVRNRDFALFVQDDWKATRRLTLSYGVRFDRNPPYFEDSRMQYFFDPASGRIIVPNDEVLAKVNPAFPRNLVPVVTAREAGHPERLFNTQFGRLVPRFGFAFRPTGNTSFAIRGAYGIYTVYSGANLYTTTTGGPFASSESFTNRITNGVPLFRFPRPFPEGFGAVGAQNFDPVDPNIGKPYIQQWNLTMEREIFGMGARLSYIATGSWHLNWAQNINQPVPSTEPSAPAAGGSPCCRTCGTGRPAATPCTTRCIR